MEKEMLKNKKYDTELKRKFEQIYSNYSGRIYNFVMKMTSGNTYVAEEITQITFVKLWEKLDALDTETTMLSYLYTIARNQFLNNCEHEMIENIYNNYILKSRSEQDNSTENTINEGFFSDFLMKAIDELPEKRKRVFILSKLEGKSNKEIAQELNISVNTVERHMTLALQFIKTKLREYCNIIIPAALLMLLV
jgi:RNA polymerase sigma-70 factor (family 1)